MRPGFQVDVPDVPVTIQTADLVVLSPGEMIPVAICQLLLPVEADGDYTRAVLKGLKGDENRQRFDLVNIGYSKYSNTGHGHRYRC